MAKLTREQKIELYKKRKSGVTISALVQIYGIHRENIKYLCRLIDLHGIEILRKDKNRIYSKEFKLKIINEVLIHDHGLNATALKYVLSSNCMLTNWIKSYKETGYTKVNKPKGRQPKMTKKPVKKKHLTENEKMKELVEELEYLRAENAVLKKLRVVVEQRKELQKKKNQK